MTNYEKMEELLYTDGEVRQQMEEHRRLRFRTADATRHFGVKLTEQSSDYTRATTFDMGLEQRFDSRNFV